MATEKNGDNFDNALLDPNEQLLLLKSIMESSTEYSIMGLDLNGKIVAWNAGAKRMYNYVSSEIIGKNSNILYDPDDLNSGKIKDIFEKAKYHEKWSGILRRISKDGRHFNAFVTITLRRDINDQPIGFTFISRDLTELENVLDILNKLKASEALLKIRNIELAKKTRELQESDRLKSEFLANASHELRTPLNGIIGFTELLYDGTVAVDSSKYKEFLWDIISSAKHLLTLINELLDLAKIEAGKIEFHPTKVDIVKLVDEVREIFHSSLNKKNINFKVEIDPVFGDIIIDPDRLKQILNNYISNALKFTPAGGRITVKIYQVHKKDFRIEVQDTGIGINSDDFPKLFVKFQQLNAGSSKLYQGTGLGLALVKHIVEAQGGNVGVESKLGEGSIFYAVLPCFPYHRTIIKNKIESTPHVQDDHHILIIENESIERQIMFDTLSESGYTVMIADNIPAALKYENKYQFDAIILDLFLPNTGNWEILRSLRSHHSQQEVYPIVITAAFEKTISTKVHDFLIKPAKPEELLNALKKAGIQPHDSKTVLIVDSDQNILAHTSQLLAEHGFRVVCKDNKISALLALEQEYPDVVILDPYMPGMDSYEFLLYYHQTERGSFTPIIIWTMKKLSDEARMRLKVPIQRVILKGKEINFPLPEGLR